MIQCKIQIVKAEGTNYFWTNIESVVNNNNGGGGGGTITAAAATPAPQMMSGAFDLSGGTEPEAFRAYVVTDEMTNSQDQLSNIRRRATV